MTIYIDSDCKCYASAAEGRTMVETDFFNGKCKAFIEGYRFVPAEREWTRSDGAVFKGEMVTPHMDILILQAYQQGYEESLAEMQDMQNALELMGVNADE